MIAGGNLSSFILWGPPGVGKTSLARIVANSLDREFYTLSAVSSGVKDVREVIDKAKADKSSMFGSGKGAPILFIDEIHRFNKAQQDALLGAVEDGTVVLIGATTENPSFEVINPLLSRCQVLVLKSLEKDDLQHLLDRALTEDEILKHKDIKVNEAEALFRYSGGDARKLLNLLEIVVDSFAGAEHIVIDNKTVESCLQTNASRYDKGGDMHYDIISAFIKSIRGSDPNAAYMIRLLDEYFKLNMGNREMERYAAKLGADCAFFITAEPAYATGIGDVLQPIGSEQDCKHYLKDYWIALVKPDVAVSTKEAYAGITPRMAQKSCREIVLQPIETWRNELVNDFEESIFPKYPVLSEIKKRLYDEGAIYAAMSGSGSTIFGIYKDKPENIDLLFPDCQAFVIRL